MNINPTSYIANLFTGDPNKSAADNFQENYQKLISDTENFLNHADSKSSEEIQRTFNEFQQKSNQIIQTAMIFIESERKKSLTPWNIQKISHLIFDFGDKTEKIDHIFNELIIRSHQSEQSAPANQDITPTRALGIQTLQQISSWIDACQKHIIELKQIDFSIDEPDIQSAIAHSHVDFIQQLLKDKNKLASQLTTLSNSPSTSLATTLSTALDQLENRLLNAIQTYHEILGLPNPSVSIDTSANEASRTLENEVWIPAVHISNSLEYASDCYLEGVGLLNTESDFYNIPESYFTKLNDAKLKLNELTALLNSEKTPQNKHVIEILLKEAETKLTQISLIENQLQNLPSYQAGSSSSATSRSEQYNQSDAPLSSKIPPGHTSNGAYIFTLSDMVDSIDPFRDKLNQVNDLVSKYNEKHPEGPPLRIRYIEEAGIVEVNHSAHELTLHFNDPILSPIRSIFYNAKGSIISNPKYYSGFSAVSLGYSQEDLKKVHNDLPNLSSRIIPTSQEIANQSPDKAIIDLITNNSGLIIGEVHGDLSPKDILIRNMQALREAGVEYLYMEGIPHTMQDALDKWYIEKHPSPLLHKFIASGFGGWHHVFDGVVQKKYLTLMQSAIDAGIKVVGIETTGNQMGGYTSSDGSSGRARALGMNIPTYYTIKKYQSENPEAKYIAFVGSSHASTSNDVKGLRELLGVPAAIISDLQGKTYRPETCVNVTNFGFGNHLSGVNDVAKNTGNNQHQVELLAFTGLRNKSFYSIY